MIYDNENTRKLVSHLITQTTTLNRMTRAFCVLFLVAWRGMKERTAWESPSLQTANISPIPMWMTVIQKSRLPIRLRDCGLPDYCNSIAWGIQSMMTSYTGTRESLIGSDETDLVVAAQKGDLEAFNQLVLAYQDRIFNMAVRILDDEESAEDITQNTFLAAYLNLPRFRNGSFRS